MNDLKECYSQGKQRKKGYIWYVPVISTFIHYVTYVYGCFSTLSLERPSSTATPTTPTGLILPSLFQLPSPTTTQYNSSSHQQQYHKPSIIWLVPADKRLPLVAVPAKHAPYGFVKYHEEFRHRIFIVRLVALI